MKHLLQNHRRKHLGGQLGRVYVCEHKIYYATLEEARWNARAEAWRLNRVLEAYPCDVCGGFHLRHVERVAEGRKQ